MAGLAPIGAIAATLDANRLAAEFAVRTLKLQLDATEQIGAQAIRLIDAATIDPQTGRNVDLSV